MTAAGPGSRRATGRPARGPSRFARWRARLGDRLARSSRVFLIGLIIACGIEVIVDWNSTLFEINVLRDGMRQRGVNYASILTTASVEPTLAYDADAMDTLSAGLFDDEDVVYVRFTDHLGETIYDRLRAGWADRFASSRGVAFRSAYASQMSDDILGILADPQRLRDHIRTEHKRDLVQVWNDLVGGVIALVAGPAKPVQRSHGVVIYQDRLTDERGGHEGQVTWALGTVVDERDDAWGVVLVGFSMDRTNAAIRTKIFKGVGMVLFFVGLILVQNILSRRDKLRLLDLETRYAVAKSALRESMPEAVRAPGLGVGGAVEQTTGSVDGMVWNAHLEGTELKLLVVDPDGDGIDAAATALQILRAFRQRCSDGVVEPLEDDAAAFGAAALTIPLTRPVGFLLLRMCTQTGRYQGLTSPVGTPQILDGEGHEPVTLSAIDSTPRGVVGPLSSFEGTLPDGGMLLALCASTHKGGQGRVQDERALSQYVLRNRPEVPEPMELAADAATWARGKLPALSARDLCVLIVHRKAAGD